MPKVVNGKYVLAGEKQEKRKGQSYGRSGSKGGRPSASEKAVGLSLRGKSKGGGNPFRGLK